MSKIVKYSKLKKRLNSKFNLSKKPKIINTMFLDEVKYENDLSDKGIYANNIVISKDVFNQDIDIRKTLARNICFENYDNLGDITIPFSYKNRLYISFEGKSKIKKINILLLDKNIHIDLEDNVDRIYISSEYNSKDINLNINIDYKNKSILYEVDKKGNIIETKQSYTITSSDIRDNSINLCNLTEYHVLHYDNLTVDTLIINKHYLEHIDKLRNFNDKLNYIPFHNRIKFDKLRIIDDNEMKLNPIDVTFNNGNYYSTTFIDGDIKYITIKNKNKCSIVYLDKNNTIKIISEEEIKKDPNVKKVYFDFFGGLFDSNSNLIIVKYNNYYKVIDFDNEYIIDSLFFILLTKKQNMYRLSESFEEYLNNYNLIDLFDTCNIGKNTFIQMYNDYISYKKYIEKLKELGFSNKAIKYLFDKKIKSIITPYEENIKNITDTEIKCFNEIGEEYVKKKRLKHDDK